MRVCLPDQDGFFKFIPSLSKSDLGANYQGVDNATSSLEDGYVTEREFLEKIQEAKYGGNDNETIIIGLFGKGSLGQADTKSLIFDELIQKDRFRGYKADNSDETLETSHIVGYHDRVNHRIYLDLVSNLDATHLSSRVLERGVLSDFHSYMSEEKQAWLHILKLTVLKCPSLVYVFGLRLGGVID